MTSQQNTQQIGYLNNVFSNEGVAPPAILTNGGNFHTQPQDPTYEAARIIRNTKFDFRPGAVILVTNTEQVELIVNFVYDYNSQNDCKIELRARSGGHDHEGECSGTDTWVIDFRNMKAVKPELVGNDWIVKIEPGANFADVSSALNGLKIAIPQGTCQTVAVTGYTMGGGWGPWTRKYGMACEHLIGATIVLGDGKKEVLTRRAPPQSQKGRLLWALRGGGGFSYGIVTELVFEALPLPADRWSVEVNFNQQNGLVRPAIEVVRQWVHFINDTKETRLLGTNLKIVAESQDPDPNARLECTFNGYFEGQRQEIEALIQERLSLDSRDDARLRQVTPENQGELFNRWEPGIRLDSTHDLPHKITSCLATNLWNDKSSAALIHALQSKSLVAPSGQDVTQYVTLGAINGPFYDDHNSGRSLQADIAFPYRDRLFTVQFQAWWERNLKSREWVNRAEDWIDTCRHQKIPDTDGSFISFKDNAVPTREYFAENYDQLKQVKEQHSKDKLLLFRTRKTII